MQSGRCPRNLDTCNTFINIIAEFTSSLKLGLWIKLNGETFDDNSSGGPLPPPGPHPTHPEGQPVGLVGSTSRRTGGAIFLVEVKCIQ